MPHWLSKMKKQDEGIAVMTYLVLLHSKMKTQDESVEVMIYLVLLRRVKLLQ